VAPEFAVEAWSVPDHIPEAIYRHAPGKSYIAATQWHPEFHNPDSPTIDSGVLLGDFLAACQRAKFQPAHGHSPFQIRDRAARLLRRALLRRR
jgi:putative glutamine amidotransferase